MVRADFANLPNELIVSMRGIFLLFFFLSLALIYDICFLQKLKLSIIYSSQSIRRKLNTSALSPISKMMLIVIISILTIILILRWYQFPTKENKMSKFQLKTFEPAKKKQKPELLKLQTFIKLSVCDQIQNWIFCQQNTYNGSALYNYFIDVSTTLRRFPFFVMNGKEHFEITHKRNAVA